MRTFMAWIVRRKWLVILATLVFTISLLAPLRSLSVIIDPDNVLPQSHPYVKTNHVVESIFGNKYTIVIGLSPKEGTIYQTPILEKVQRITQRLQNAPGVIRGNINSLAARRSKSIAGNEEGMIVAPLMEKVPRTAEEMAALKQGLMSNPVYTQLLVSEDQGTTQIIAEFKRLEGGMKAVHAAVKDAVDPERDATVDIQIAGMPVFLSLLERYSERMGFLFPIALLIIGLIHYEAFRTLQALILPLVTALLAVAWALGFLALLGQPLDVFNSATPILILAIAAGHAVQILKRFYEEYKILTEKQPNLSPRDLNDQAVLETLTKVGPVMITACVIAALGFFSLIIFEIKTIRTFGLFTGVGILSALVLELTFIPALRSLLPAPSARELARERSETFWDRLVDRFYRLATERRLLIFGGTLLLLGGLSLGAYWLEIDNSQKAYFYGKIQERVDDDRLNLKMAGTNPIYVLIESDSEDRIKDPEVLAGMERVQRFMEQDPLVGKTVSLVDFIKRMNQAMNADDPKAYVLPTQQDLVAQYLLLYSNSGEPGDFDSYVDYGYQKALVQAFLKTDSSQMITAIIRKTEAYAKEQFPDDVKVSVGGGAAGGVALNEVMIREKILNIVQIMGAVFLVSSLVFRSFLAGLLILVPLIAAVFVNFGIMGLLGIPLQIATALVSAMAVGIGADYGIYMSYRLREELSQGADEEQAIKKAFRSAGKATLFVSTAVAGGFGVLMLSWGFMIHLWMGFLIGTAMVVSSVAALTIFPALIFTIRPRYIFQPRSVSMSRVLVSAAIVFLCAGAFFTQLQAAEPSAQEIMEKNFVTSKVIDSTSNSRFRLINANGQERVRETVGATKLRPGSTDNMRLVTFESPADVKGTKTLLIENSQKDDDIWVYLPAMKKVRRLVASNKKDSFVGTDFSYGDVIGHKVSDWNHKLLRSETIGGRSCYLVESTPKAPEVAELSGYSKRIGCIDKESFVGLSGELFDGAGQLLKKITARDIQQVDTQNNRWQPMILEAENVQTGHRTIIEFRNFKANVGVSDELFTTRTLEKK
jgi:predicted RND superfamily exporter protein/outer membrane lipoprotein-sorting protein